MRQDKETTTEKTQGIEEMAEAEQQTNDASVTLEEATSEPEATVEDDTPTAVVTEAEGKQEEEKAQGNTEDVKVTSETELLSTQEKAKLQGNIPKKPITGAGMKKRSTKKTKEHCENKLAKSGEQTAEQFQFSTDSTEVPEAESGPPSPKESGEHVIVVELIQKESGQETDAEATSDGEKNDGITAWSSLEKPLKKSSDSEDEAACKPQAKSATLPPSASADEAVEEETAAAETAVKAEKHEGKTETATISFQKETAPNQELQQEPSKPQNEMNKPREEMIAWSEVTAEPESADPESERASTNQNSHNQGFSNLKKLVSRNVCKQVCKLFCERMYTAAFSLCALQMWSWIPDTTDTTWD